MGPGAKVGSWGCGDVGSGGVGVDAASYGHAMPSGVMIFLGTIENLFSEPEFGGPNGLPLRGNPSSKVRGEAPNLK